MRIFAHPQIHKIFKTSKGNISWNFRFVKIEIGFHGELESSEIWNIYQAKHLSIILDPFIFLAHLKVINYLSLRTKDILSWKGTFYCLVHVIWTERRLSKLVLNVKYFLLLYFLTATEFYNFGHIQGIIRVHF